MSELNRINISDRSGIRNPNFGKVFELPWRNEFLRLLYAYILVDDFSKLSIPKVKKILRVCNVTHQPDFGFTDPSLINIYKVQPAYASV